MRLRYLASSKQDPYEAASARVEATFQEALLPAVWNVTERLQDCDGAGAACIARVAAEQEETAEVVVEWKPPSFVAAAMQKVPVAPTPPSLLLCPRAVC
jgi:hypothetical protein